MPEPFDLAGLKAKAQEPEYLSFPADDVLALHAALVRFREQLEATYESDQAKYAALLFAIDAFDQAVTL